MAIKTPAEKYMQDPQFHELVMMLESFIDRAQFTPSELREAAVLASINYEMRNVRSIRIDPELAEALELLDSRFTRRPR